MKVLIVDDEYPIRELIKYNVEKDNFSVIDVENGTQALIKSRSEKPDIIILDLMLPDMSGLDICRVLKGDAETSSIPIIMVTAKTEDSDIITGLELGADDYITKPFSPKVLLARIHSVLRRRTASGKDAADSEIMTHNLRIIPLKHELYKGKQKIDLSATEFAILIFLAQHPGQVFSRQQIISSIKGDSYPVTERSIDVQILNIRRKIEDNSNQSIIETIRGVGYRLTEEEEKND